MESINTRMELYTKATGRTISSMEKARRPGLTVLSIKGNIIWGKNMGKGYIIGMMDPAIQEIGKTTKSLAMASTSGSTVDNTPETGSTTTCMAKFPISKVF